MAAAVLLALGLCRALMWLELSTYELTSHEMQFVAVSLVK